VGYASKHRVVRHVLIGCATFVAACLLSPTSMAAPSEEGCVNVRSEAASPGAGSEARQAAAQKAQDDIIGQVLKTSLGMTDPSWVGPILAQKERYIRSTQLLRYETVEAETRVEVECSVNRALLLQDAAGVLLPRMPSPPTVLVLVAEQDAHDKPAEISESGAAATEVTKTLRKASFDVVETAPVRSCHSGSELTDAVRAANDAAGAFAREGFAEVVVLGEAMAAAESPATAQPILAITGKITLRVFRARDGKCIDTLSQEALVNANDAEEGIAAVFEDACAKLSKDLTVLCTMAMVQAHAPNELVITLEEPGTLERLDAFIKHFGETIGQKDIEVLFFSEHLARVRGQYDGAMIPLMDALSGRAYEGLTLETRKALNRNITLRFAKP
jgi:hypothetical protein